MAKDPAFLFYDADAARDVSHMNRLERGAYFDIMQAQKKFGRMSLTQIKKILGNDYEQCWPGVSMVMVAAESKYYIQWVEDSLIKRANYTKSRSANRKGKHTAEVVPVEPEQTGAKEPLVQRMAEIWKSVIKSYAYSETEDFPALLDFMRFICKQHNVSMVLLMEDTLSTNMLLGKWLTMCKIINDHPSWRKKSLSNLAKFNKQEIYAQTMDPPEEKRMVI